MADTNYISGIVKILETPKQQIGNNDTNILSTNCRAQIRSVNKSSLITLKFWGNLANDLLQYYSTNDYILIEGYIGLKNKSVKNFNNIFPPKKIEITVLRVYPVLLNQTIK